MQHSPETFHPPIMRNTVLLLLSLLFCSSLFAQPQATNYANLVLYVPDTKAPYVEVWYTGSMRRLEKEMQQVFRDSAGKKIDIDKEANVQHWKGIHQPVFTGTSYNLTMQIQSRGELGNLLRFYLKNEEPEFDMLQSRMNIFRQVMGILQEIIDEEQDVEYYSKEQNPNNMYLYAPEAKQEVNLHCYLFMYSMEPLDSTVKKLSEWMVYNSENRPQGQWINDSTFRIDGLKQVAFGYNETFSLTIQHSLVDRGYHQYILYVSNYKEGDFENNYEVRPYDLQVRFWRFYNILLTSSARR